MDRAVIYIRTGAILEQQEIACLAHCTTRGYVVDSICHHPKDAIALAADGVVQVVVTAYDDTEDQQTERALRRAGARLEYVREPRRQPRHIPSADLAVGMHERGMPIEAIARLLEEDTGDVRAALRQAGLL